MLNLHKLAKRKSTSKKKNFFFYFLATHGMWYPSSLTRHHTHVHYSGSSESYPLDHWGSPINFVFREGLFPKAQQERRKGGVTEKGNVKLLNSSALLFLVPASQDGGSTALRLLLLQRRRLGLRRQDARAERLSSRKPYPPLMRYFSHGPPNLQHLGHL